MEVADVISKEQAVTRVGHVNPYAVATHVAVSGAGVFRLSKLGNLHQVLNPDLILLDAGRTISVGSAENVLRLFGTTFNDRPAIGLLRKVRAFGRPSQSARHTFDAIVFAP